MATTTDAVHAAGEAAAHGGAFPPFDTSTFASQLLWLAIAFGVTYYVISKIAGPRISGILEDRHDRIASDLAEADRLKRETDEALQAYETALGDARAKAQTLAIETRDRLSAQTAAKRHESEEALGEKLAEAERRIAAIKTQALAQVDSIALEATTAIMEKLAPSAPAAGAVAKAIEAASKA